MELQNIKKILETTCWVYNPSRNYDMYLGKKVYLCTKWDDRDMINLKNYGTVVDITDTYICINTGFWKNYIQLPGSAALRVTAAVVVSKVPQPLLMWLLRPPRLRIAGVSAHAATRARRSVISTTPPTRRKR